MTKHILGTLAATFCAFAVFAQQAQIPAVPGAPAAAPPPASRALPPEAFTITTNYILIVNLNSVVDAEWLDEHSTYMRSQLSCGVVNAVEEGAVGVDARAFVRKLRAKHEGNAKIIIILSDEKDIAPILASPYELWAVMDANWVKAGGGDAETLNLRMGKRIFQTLGHIIGAGHRMEKEAVMRFTPTPQLLDDCLSRGFHPLNSGIFMQLQRFIGLDSRRPRPLRELIEMGIIQPRPRPADAETAAPPSETQPTP